MNTHAIPTREAAERRCAQCGRVGVRGFKTLGVSFHPIVTVCANVTACRKRWPRERGDDE